MKKIILFISLLLLFTGCSNEEPTTEYVEIEKEELSRISSSPGGSIIIPLINYETLNPLCSNNSSVYYFSKLVYDSLFVYNEEGQIEANLVEHYVLSPDKTILTLTLKEDIIWHDGSKLTTQDVLDTFNFIKNAEVESPYYKLFRNSVGYGIPFDASNFLKMEIFDQRNIDLHFDKPYADHLDMLTFPILPSNQLNNLSEEDKFDMIGSGPYKLKEIREGIHIELERNDNYHGRLPYISNVFGKIFENDELSSLAFETGQINLYLSKEYDWGKYQDNPRVKIEEFSSNEMDMIVFNNRRGQFSGDKGKKIKQGIARAINKKRIIDRLFLGKAVETSIPVNLNTTNFYGLKSDTYYNEERAKELLNEAGYEKMNEMGLLINENGETIDVEVKSNFSNSYKRIAADFIVQDLRAIGINAFSNYNFSSSETLNAEQVEKENEKFRNDLQNGDFDIALITVNLTDIVDMGALLHTNSIGNGMNYGYYSNYNLDYILERLKLESDYEIAKENYLSAIRIFTEDMPIVPLYIKTNALLVDESLQGEVNPIQSDIYRKFRNMFILKQFQ